GDHDRQRRTARRPPGHTGETPAARPVLDDAEDRDEYAERDQRRADPERYTGRPSGGRAHRWLERTQEQPEASDHEAQAEERDRRPAPGKEGLLDREPGPAGISLGVARRGVAVAFRHHALSTARSVARHRTRIESARRIATRDPATPLQAAGACDASDISPGAACATPAASCSWPSSASTAATRSCRSGIASQSALNPQ